MVPQQHPAPNRLVLSDHAMALLGRAFGILAVTMLLALAGWGVAVSLDSPLLAIVAVGMLFLTGVSLRGAVEPHRR
jgi:hypothetical protein